MGAVDPSLPAAVQAEGAAEGGAPVNRLRAGRERTLAAIRAAAIVEFSQHGFKGASTQAIAERAGLTKPQLHYYIRGKDELYEELLGAVLQGWSSAFVFDAPREGLPAEPRQVLAEYVRRKLDYALDHPGLSRIFTGEVLSGGPKLGRYWPEARRSTQRKVEVIEGWIAQGLVRPLDARVLLMQIWGMTQHYADYGVQVRVMLGLPPDAPLDRAPIALQITNFVLLGCGLAPLQDMPPAPGPVGR
ncbi:TetR/AcrR family transcriptional regulator [Curvibacter sp. RS43]|uniref:TetR/AcrR family transcriptional regulator n=1 Tax=Curvibacter microcysteis TaxID=3026419 RepID=A0ABT5MDH3_9BURK|nr:MULTISPECIES: TetR/AcrR family transcriptional regulator [unclassified Curvibacter]MDD0810168.1 TetR/AcrR family transcriptional regulator [Curvibacter sp. RS43]MDD0814643.1 TetR/AcrR family transcriptional regulator [Curvibacter sp. HBC28]